MLIRSAVINVMMKAAQTAGRNLLRDFNEVEKLQVTRKGPADFVSVADKKAEALIHKHLSKARPDYGFLMEETGETKGEDPDYRFIIDPLDGTTNFLHGLPHFCVSIGLEKQGELVAGAVYDPIRDEHFWAEKGKGAFLGDARLRVSGRKHLQDCIFATGIPFLGRMQENQGHENFLKEQANMMAVSAGIRRFGSAALDLCYVAAGRYDGYWESHLSPWDTAAGAVIAQEAGAIITTNKNKPWNMNSKSLICASMDLHPKMIKELIRKD